MKLSTTIRLKSFFMLLIFTGSMAAFCHCNHAAAAKPEQVTKKSCCKKQEVKAEQDPCKEEGCCESKLVKLNSLEKQMAEKVAINPVFFISLLHQYFSPQISIAATINTHPAHPNQRWRTAHPPDLCILNQAFRI